MATNVIEIFVSYKSENEVLVNFILANLKSYVEKYYTDFNIKINIDKEKLVAGDNFRTQITGFISSSRAILVFLSKEAINKPDEIKREVQQAISQGKKIIPVFFNIFAN